MKTNADRTEKMEEVPHEVWDEVYEKWERMLATGWNDGCWTGCRLCTWLSSLIGETMSKSSCMDYCPLYEGEWCRLYPTVSRLHWGYEKEPRCALAWRYRVIVFLEFIKPYCSRDEDGE